MVVEKTLESPLDCKDIQPDSALTGSRVEIQTQVIPLPGDPPALSGRVPGLPSTPQDEAGLTRKFETSPVGGPTCGKTPISRSALNQQVETGMQV